MKTEEIALSRVSENEANPREISQANFQKLVQSIIVFPRMLTLRLIVVDETFHALGGNMRLKALQHIVTMDEASIQVKLDAEQRLSDEEQAALMEYWQGWQQQPTVTVVSASDLTEAQKQEFMIKDNLSFGNWDFSDLANRWDSAQLQNWGMPVWNPAPAETSSSTSKCKGYVRWSDIKLDAENLLRVRLEKAMNLGTREKYSKYYTMSAADYMKWCWNNPQAAHSPYKMFEGAMVPADERDSEGNIVYKYNGAKF